MFPAPLDTPIPGWARWLAQDQDGAWWAYEAEPNQQHNGWYENEVGRIQRLVRGIPPADWRESLIRLEVQASPFGKGGPRGI